MHEFHEFYRLKQTWRLAKAIAEMKSNAEQMMKLEWLCKVSYECELNSWPVIQSVRGPNRIQWLWA